MRTHLHTARIVVRIYMQKAIENLLQSSWRCVVLCCRLFDRDVRRLHTTAGGRSFPAMVMANVTRLPRTQGLKFVLNHFAFLRWRCHQIIVDDEALHVEHTIYQYHYISYLLGKGILI